MTIAVAVAYPQKVEAMAPTPHLSHASSHILVLIVIPKIIRSPMVSTWMTLSDLERQSRGFLVFFIIFGYTVAAPTV